MPRRPQTKKKTASQLQREISAVLKGRPPHRVHHARAKEDKLDVYTNAHHGGVESGDYQVTIERGASSITAPIEAWEDAIAEARERIRNAEWEY